jgi:hypothetical protein
MLDEFESPTLKEVLFLYDFFNWSILEYKANLFYSVELYYAFKTDVLYIAQISSFKWGFKSSLI